MVWYQREEKILEMATLDNLGSYPLQKQTMLSCFFLRLITCEPFTNILNSPFCRPSRAGCRGILLAVGTSGATLGTRPAIITPPSRATSWRRWPDSWREWRTFRCSDRKMLSEIIKSKFCRIGCHACFNSWMDPNQIFVNTSN